MSGKAPHILSERQHRENWEWADRTLAQLEGAIKTKVEMGVEFPSVASIPQNQTVATLQALSRPALMDGTIMAFYVHVHAKSGATNPTIQVYNESSDAGQVAVTDVCIINTAPKTYKILPLKSGVNEGDVFGIRCTTGVAVTMTNVCGGYRMRPRWETS